MMLTHPLRTALGAATLSLTLASCSLSVDTHLEPVLTPGPGPVAGGCPAAIAKLTDPTASATAEWNGKFDKTKSMIDSPEGKARLESQVRALVKHAVADGAALRLSVFAGSVATVTDVVVCPTLAAKFNNPAAEARKTAHLKQVAGDAAWAAVRDARPPAGGKGSSIAGGWAALADDQPLAPHRRAVMVSDGQGPRDESPADLSGYEATGLYAVGRVAGRAATTQATTELVESWRTWLTAHHAQQLIVTSQELQ